jgi:two-component system sensor histidine kinase KdpD
MASATFNSALRAGNTKDGRSWRQPSRGVAAGISTSAAGLLTLAAFQYQLDLATAALLDLVVLIPAARYLGFRIAATIPVTALVVQTCLPAHGALKAVDVVIWVVLGYCVAAFGTLSGNAAAERRVAEGRRRDIEGLCEISRLVLLMDRRREPGPQIAEFIPRVFRCESAVIFDGATATAASAGNPAPDLEGRARDAYVEGTDSQDESRGRWFRVLRAGNRRMGSLAVQGTEISESVANALASLAAAAMERTRSFENENRAEAARQSEQLRTAVLDALAHDIKTPLTAIRAASSGLLEMQVLDPARQELIGLIDEESARLDEIASRLLRLARLDARDVNLKLSGLSLSRLIAGMAGPRVKAEVEEEIFVAADEQLLITAISQLLDNALKYSSPSCVVTVRAGSQGSEAVVSVHNQGVPIAEADRERIFERFYRAGQTASCVSGTGLGLSITRKIAIAHGGRVWVVSNEAGSTTFFLSLPLSRKRGGEGL